MNFNWLRQKPYWLLVENHSAFLGPKDLAFGPFASQTSAELQRLSWQSHEPVLRCVGVVCEIPKGYIKQEVISEIS